MRSRRLLVWGLIFLLHLLVGLLEWKDRRGMERRKSDTKIVFSSLEVFVVFKSIIPAGFCLSISALYAAPNLLAIPVEGLLICCIFLH